MSVSCAFVTVQEWCKLAFVGLQIDIALLLVVSQNRCCAVQLRNPRAQIYFKISRVSFIVSRSFPFIVRGRLAGDNDFLFSPLLGLLSAILA